MNAIKSKVVKSIKNKRINILLFFFGIAFLFSILTKLSDTYTKTLTFNIKPINVPEEKVVLLDSSHFIDITVTSKGFDLVKYYFDKPVLDIDFTILEQNRTHYLWTEGEQLSHVINQLDNDLKIENITPDSLFFNYDSNAIKLVPIKLKQELDFKSGFDIVGDFILEPDSVKLIGPKSIIDTISFISTNNLKLDKVNSNVQRQVEVDMSHISNEVSVSQKKVKVSGVVDKFTEGSITVPIALKNAPKDAVVKFYPKEVEVIFYTSLGHYKNIKEKDFIVECNYETNSNQTYLIPKIIRIPQGVKNVRLNTKQIEYIVVK